MSVPVVAVIPARAGSKGIPRKNLTQIAGRSLVDLAIHVAQETASINLVIVSSDDAEVLELARCLGVHALRRPTALATDQAGIGAAVQHALQSLAVREATVVLLQPTSPLRHVSDVESALAAFDGVHPVVSVTIDDHPPEWSFRLSESHALETLTGTSLVLRRQDADPSYHLNGAVYVAAAEDFAAGRPLVREGTKAIVMPRERSIDIDTMLDLKIARLIFGDGGPTSHA